MKFPVVLALAVSPALWLSQEMANAADAPAYAIVVAEDAPELERLAADELQAQFRKLWNATVSLAATAPDDADSTILLGSPRTNPAIRDALGDQWPNVSDQGIVLRSVKTKSGSQLVVGGGSPVATLWAAYELGHQLGIRYLLQDDAYPAEPPEFRIDGWDIVREPNLRSRAWRTINDFPIGPEAWGIEEHRRMLRQLAKLKFNRVLLSIYPWQPFVHYEFRGVQKQTATLWYGFKYPIDGDIPSRAIFGGAKEFYNPDLAGTKSYEELTRAGIQLVRGIIDESHRLGMTVGLSYSPLEFPKEFAAVLPGAKIVRQMTHQTIGPGEKQSPDDPLLRELATIQLRSLLETYSQLDALYLTLPEFPEWEEHAEAAWDRLKARADLDASLSLKDLEQAARKRTTLISGERGARAVRGNATSLDFLQTWLDDPKLLETVDGRRVELYVTDVDSVFYPYLERVLPKRSGSLQIVDYTARRVAEHLDVLKTLPVSGDSDRLIGDPSLVLTLADDNVGLLPQLATRNLAKLTQGLREMQWAGYTTRYWIPGDLDPSVHFLSRVAYDPSVTPDAAYEDLVRTTCGEGVAERLLLAWDHIEAATDEIDRNDIGFAFPVPSLVMKHYEATEPPPAWWQTVSDHYLNAVNEMYRAHDRAAPSGRKLLYRLARRYEFGLEYITAMQAVRAAGVARSQKDAATQQAKLEAAAESLYNGMTALASVAEDSSYKGVIAVVTEYGFRPLQREIERLQEESAAAK